MAALRDGRRGGRRDRRPRPLLGRGAEERAFPLSEERGEELEMLLGGGRVLAAQPAQLTKRRLEPRVELLILPLEEHRDLAYRADSPSTHGLASERSVHDILGSLSS
jgi:hypothetical protein